VTNSLGSRGAGIPRQQALPALIRPARAADAASIASVYVDSWRTTYAGILPAHYLASLSQRVQGQGWRHLLTIPGTATFVAENPLQQVVGFANAGPERGASPRYFAELYTLYLLEPYQGQGIGSGLIGAVARKFMQIGLRSMLVWVLRDNPARGFYEALGGEPLYSKPVGVGGATFVEVAYGWRDVRVLT
jgi:GNAT superfamily N-acetyltransferase